MRAKLLLSVALFVGPVLLVGGGGHAAPAATGRVSVSSAGDEANMESAFTAMSADGRSVASSSLASNLMPGDTNGYRDIFVQDLGDLCADGEWDRFDNCPDMPNPEQTDTDLDGLGNACDPPEMPPLLEKLLELRRFLIESPERAFPAPPGYRLPWLAGASHTVVQAPGESPTHQSLHAWDFDLRYELVLAARGGRVSMVRVSERAGGCDSAFSGRANYILIDHGDGTSALYLHIDYEGALVQEGALVAQGDAIAYSGSSGLSCGGGGWAGPHLHFQVQRTVPGEWWSETIPIIFDELEGDTLVTGKSYLSGNLPSGPVSRVLANWFLRRTPRGTEVFVSPSRSFLSQVSDLASAPSSTRTSPSTVTSTPTPAPTATTPLTTWEARFRREGPRCATERELARLQWLPVRAQALLVDCTDEP
ncbi:MAG: M23 family metallopeptidase [Dehalococcoidia bacterium]